MKRKKKDYKSKLFNEWKKGVSYKYLAFKYKISEPEALEIIEKGKKSNLSKKFNAWRTP